MCFKTVSNKEKYSFFEPLKYTIDSEALRKDCPGFANYSMPIKNLAITDL
jgi:hypothetical protein